MTRWKGKSFERNFEYSSKTSRENSAEEDDEELYLDYSELHSSSMNAHLLFTKESISASSKSGPLFQNPTRGSFLIMTCRRTLFACRGLLMFCLLVFIVVAVVASYSDKIAVNQGDNASRGDSVVNNKQTVMLSMPFYKNTSNGSVSNVEIELNVNCSYRAADFASIKNSLRKGIEFYEKNVENITVIDAALGTKILSEQVKKIKQLHPGLPTEISSFLGDLTARAVTVTDKILATVKSVENGTEGLKHTLPWFVTKDLWNLPLNGRWHMIGQLESYNPPDGESFEDLSEITSRKEAIDEYISDSCIYQVFNCHSNNVSENCQEAFLTTVDSMYSLTHQVIYMLLFQKKNCVNESSWNQVPVLRDNGETFMEKMCGRVWQEANSIAEANFPLRFRDLLVEQIGMCSLAGYREFLRTDWLRRLIRWQANSGCFGQRKRDKPTIEALLNDYQKRQKEQHLQQHGTTSKIRGRRRYKRSDMFLEDGNEKCSVHFTSVSITALAIHLRYFFDSCLDA